MTRKSSILNTIAFIIAILIAIAWTLCYYWHEYDGDDINYLLTFTSSEGLCTGYYSEFWKWPVYCVKHWIFSNGRAANYLLATPMLSLCPKWFNALFCGILFFGTQRLVYLNSTPDNRRSGLTQIFVTVILALAFPWWDEGFQFDVSLNYIGTSCLIMGAMYLWKHSYIAIRHKWSVIFLFVLSGMMHEAASISIVIAAVVVCMTHVDRNSHNIIIRIKDEWYHLNPQRRTMALSFILGTAIVALSPGIWLRFFKVQNESDNILSNMTLTELLTSTLPLLIILLVLLALMSVTAKGRLHLRQLFARDSFKFWFIAAVFGALFVFAGKLKGNTGWFSELFSLCALAMIFNDAQSRAIHVLKLTLVIPTAVLVIYNSFHIADYQHEVSTRIRQIRKLYAGTSDEAVFYDLPAPITDKWLFDRIHDLNDNDYYTLTLLAHYYGKEEIVVLPTNLQSLDLDSIIRNSEHDMFHVNENLLLTTELPTDAKRLGGHWTNSGRWSYNGDDGKKYIIRKFRLHGKHYYALSADLK